MDQALLNFNKILGMENWRITEFPPAGSGDVTRIYHGEPEDFTGRFCFYDWGNIELELIQPLSGRSVWFDFLERVPGGIGLHHIKFMTDHHEPVAAYFGERGILPVTSGEGVGPNAGRVWTFYDTLDKLGFDVEIINRIKEVK